VLLDVRSDAEWAGARRYLSRTGGRIPGAVHLVWRDLLAPDGTIDRSAALAARLASLGLSPDRAVIAYCVGGVRSGEAFVALKALGFRDVRNYDGSWWDWERRR
jgi:thiosulfate/3-mercaptopyruvate sulfurtransferase